MSARQPAVCRVCDGTHLSPAVDLGDQPWANHFLTREEVGREPRYPLRVVFCETCATAQLDFTVGKEVMFGDHTYLSGVTRSLSDHFREVARNVDERFFREVPGKAVLDIGSNDGTQLKHFQTMGYEVLGVESSRSTAALANAGGVPTLNRFYNLDVQREIGRRFDVINAAGVFFHLEELHGVAEAIREGLKDNGVFVVQFLYMKSIVENLAFDQLYHEHLLYYTLQTIEALLNRHGLALFDAELVPIHGGTIVGYAGRRGTRDVTDRLEQLRRAEAASAVNTLASYRSFASRIIERKKETLLYLDGLKARGKRVFGFGAPVKGNTLLNTFGIGPDRIECLVEKNELRRGLFAPGSHIPVLIERELPVPPDVYFVLAWNFKREILANNRALLDRGVQFHFPVDPPVAA